MKPASVLLLDGVVVPIVARLVAGRVLNELARADELGYVYAWDESKHPRNPKGDGDGGRWVSTGGKLEYLDPKDSTFSFGNTIGVYHGTLDTVLAGIRKDGLKVVVENRRFPSELYEGNRNGAVFVTESAKVAFDYGKTASRNGKRGTPVVLRIEVPRAEWAKFREDKHAPGDKAHFLEGSIPSSWIKSAAKLSEGKAVKLFDESISPVKLVWAVILVREEEENATHYAQAQIDYAQIARDLDELEARSKDALIPLLKASRDALLAAVRRARNPRRLARMVRNLRLSGMPRIRATLRAMLRRAWAQGGEDARTEVGPVKTHASYASPSFTPRGAVSWMNAKELFITGLLGDQLVGRAKGVIINALKTGEAGSVTVEKLWRAFEPFIGDPDVLRAGEPLAPYQLETIIRTNTTEAYNHGRLNEFVREDLLPFLDGVRYSAVMDSRTTPVCAFLDGKVFDPESPDLAALLPPNHFNALVEGTLIRTRVRGNIPIEKVLVGEEVLTHRGRWRKVYATMGKTAERWRELQLSTGGCLRVTHEHPVLTNAGWKSAGNLEIGDELFEYREQVSGAAQVSRVGPDHYPSLFDEPAVAWEAVCQTLASTVHLKGNTALREGEVDYISSDRMLVKESYSTLREEFKSWLFVVGARNLAPRFGSALCCTFRSTWCKIRIALCHTLGVLVRPFVAFLAQPPSPVFLTASFSDYFGQAVADGDLFFFGANKDPMPSAPCGERRTTKLEFMLNGAQRLAKLPVVLGDDPLHGGLISELHSASPIEWIGSAITASIEEEGHARVYNLAVEEDETYLAEDVVVHNCRSIIVPIVAGEKIDEADFITPDEVGHAMALADAKFLAQEDAHRSYMIRHEGDEWVVRSADGGKVLGRHKTEDEAKAQLRAIEAAKHNHN